VNSPIVIFPTWGDQQGVSFQLDNVRYEVGQAAPVSGEIYIDGPDAAWALWDCCGGSTPEEVAVDGRGNVAQYTYNATPTVAGFEAVPAVDIGDFAGGTLEFDMYLVSEPTAGASNWWLKTEAPGETAVVEVPITASAEAVEPPLGAWQHYTFSLDTLVSQGFDLNSLRLVMIFPTWSTGDGAVVQLDNVIFVPAP
jgi:hypothetical protein